MRFIPLVSFQDEDLKSHYCPGLYYTVRDGNALLVEKAKEWAAAGMVEIIDADGPGAGSRLRGAGIIN